MKKFMIILMFLKMSKESKRKYTYDEYKNLNKNDKTYGLYNKRINNDTDDGISRLNSSQIMHNHAKLGKYEFPNEFFIVNKDNDLPVLSEEDVNSCLDEVENASNSAEIFELSSINSCPISSPENKTSENGYSDNLVFPEKSLSIDKIKVYNEDDMIRSRNPNNNMDNKSNFIIQKNELNCIKEPIVCEKTTMMNLNLSKTLTEKNIIKNNLQFNGYIKNHTKRIQNMEEAFFILEEYKQSDKTYKSCFGIENDRKLVKNLFKFFSELDNSLTFNQDSCLKFLTEFNMKLFYALHALELRKTLSGLSNERRKIIFYSELMRLYKYVVDVPELLTLGGFYFHESYQKTIYVMHLINLFCENVKNVKENRTYIMFLIYKTFNSHFGRNFNMFRIPYFELDCCNFKHDLTFFTWELNDLKRKNMKRRLKDNKFTYNDKKWLKIVLFLFFYQHTIFIKYFNIDSENVSIFQDFIEKVIQSENCVGCLFDEYLSILQQSIKKV